DGSEPDASAASTGAAYEHERTTRSHFADRVAGHLDGQQHVLLHVAAHLIWVDLGQGRVVRATAADHDVVDGSGQLVEELLEPSKVRCIEGGRAQRVHCVRRLLKALCVAAGENDLGTHSAG